MWVGLSATLRDAENFFAIKRDKLRRNRAHVKFRRQQPIASYIPDFYCYAARLAIELDGLHHDHPDQREYDDARTLFLESTGARVLRFSNEEVLHQTDIPVLKHSPPPLPQNGRSASGA